MLTVFNSFQITALFAAFPFLIGWLFNAEFQWHSAAAWAALVAYVVYFGFMVTSVVMAIDSEKR